MKKIAVVTGTRAEYGLLKPVIEKIEQSEELEPQLIVTGMHLLESRGYTVREIEQDGIKIDKVIPMYLHGGDASFLGMGVGLGITAITTALKELETHLLLILGDRFEPFVAAIAAMTLNIPIAHIHGGDSTISGSVDNRIKYALAKISHLHFVASEESATRIRRMGEEPWRIYLTGSPGIDAILNAKLLSKEEICQKLGLNSQEPVIICVQHPAPYESKSADEQMAETLEAVKELKIQTVVIYPNSDPGADLIIRKIEECRPMPFIHIYEDLPHSTFISLMKNADVMIGNSSSGIFEAPSLKLPAVNIGIRNRGREHAENVIYVDHKKEEIINAIRKAISDKRFKEKVERCKSPFGEGNASDKIVNILEKLEIDRKLLAKQTTY